jgi:hypothetical protein
MGIVSLHPFYKATAVGGICRAGKVALLLLIKLLDKSGAANFVDHA